MYRGLPSGPCFPSLSPSSRNGTSWNDLGNKPVEFKSCVRVYFGKKLTLRLPPPIIIILRPMTACPEPLLSRLWDSLCGKVNRCGNCAEDRSLPALKGMPALSQEGWNLQITYTTAGGGPLVGTGSALEGPRALLRQLGDVAVYEEEGCLVSWPGCNSASFIRSYMLRLLASSTRLATLEDSQPRDNTS